MKILRLIFFSSILLLTFLSCHNYNKITYKKNDRQKTNSAEFRKEKSLSEAEVKDSSIMAQTEEPQSLPESKKGQNEEVLVHSSGIKTFDRLNELPQHVSQIRDDIKQLRHQKGYQKDTGATKFSKPEGEGISIFLAIILVVVVLGLIILIISLLIIKSAIEETGNSCYVATMAYGDNDAPQVNTLRAYRDQHLNNSELGRRFIRWYYANSPGFVERHRSKIWLHKLCKGGLNILVFFLKKFYTLK